MCLKIPAGSANLGSSTPQTHKPICNASQDEVRTTSSSKYTSLYWFVLAIGAIEFLFISSGWWFVFRRERKPTSTSLEEEGWRVISSQFRQFTYKEIEKATGRFMDEIGRGGSGAVYKGVLDDKRVVAVKKLEDEIQGEFGAELSVIRRIYHMNLVRIWGFCSEGQHKLLVSEYVANGSLDKHIFNEHGTRNVLGWSERFEIAVGVRWQKD